MKALAFVIGLCIVAIGAVGIVAPTALIRIAQWFRTPADWYALGAARVAFGLLLISVAKTSRAPRMLRIVALIPLIAGLGALATAIMGVERARAAIEWWSQLGSGYMRLSLVPVLVVGGFVAYACAPGRRAA